MCTPGTFPILQWAFTMIVLSSLLSHPRISPSIFTASLEARSLSTHRVSSVPPLLFASSIKRIFLITLMRAWIRERAWKWLTSFSWLLLAGALSNFQVPRNFLPRPPCVTATFPWLFLVGSSFFSTKSTAVSFEIFRRLLLRFSTPFETIPFPSRFFKTFFCHILHRD